MTLSYGVCAASDAYQVASAELPLRTRSTADPRGAIVVVTGETGWESRLQLAEQQGAVAIILTSRLTDADGAPRQITSGVPVIVDRPAIRADLLEDALRGRGTTRPRFVQVECTSSTAEREAVLRDSVGWVRELLGSPLEVVTARETRTAVLLQLRTTSADGESPAFGAVVFGLREDAPPRIRALALDAIRTEVTVDLAAGSSTVVHTDSRGRLQSPRRFESAERLAVRRALDSLAGRTHPDDLELLAHDAGCVCAALEGAK